MIADLKPYAKYKETGLPWLKEIPTGWTTARTKTRFRLRIEKSGKDHGKELLSIYTRIGVRPRKELEQKGNKATTTNDYWIVKRGDIICNKLLAWMGAIGMSNYEGVTSPAYDILRPVLELETMYYHHLFRTNLYLQQFKHRSRGIMEMRLRLYFDQFGQIPILCPPLDDQRAIVRFLDYANGRLEKTIRAKRKVIALLNEQKQAIIHRAVTRGLDPNVPLKSSGIPWLGDIPKHWSIRRLKSFVSNVADQTLTMRADEVYIALENVESWTGRVKPQRMQDEVLFTGQVKRFQVNDVLFGKLRPYLAKVITVSLPGVCVGEFFVLRVDSSLASPQFIELFLRTKMIIDVINSSTFGAKMPRADWQFVGNLPVELPPISEQNAIVSGICSAMKPLDTSIERFEGEISLLREYRTRLIADVVTGKLDVREAARNLPEETVESGIIDDNEISAGDEELEESPEMEREEA